CLAAALLASTPAIAATIVVRDNGDIVFTGPIMFNDDRALLAVVGDDTSTKRTIFLGSDGGFVDAAIAVADVIRSRGYATSVPSRCSSACAIVFAAGRPHALGEGAMLGIHCSWSLNEPYKCNAVGTRQMVEYLVEAGAPARLITLQANAG